MQACIRGRQKIRVVTAASEQLPSPQRLPLGHRYPDLLDFESRMVWAWLPRDQVLSYCRTARGPWTLQGVGHDWVLGLVFCQRIWLLEWPGNLGWLGYVLKSIPSLLKLKTLSKNPFIVDRLDCSPPWPRKWSTDIILRRTTTEYINDGVGLERRFVKRTLFGRSLSCLCSSKVI